MNLSNPTPKPTSISQIYCFHLWDRRLPPVRKTLFYKKLFVESSDTLIENTSAWSNWKQGDPSRQERTKRYAETLARSKFVLCPRVIGTTSYRLFETMQMRRVPVIISDAWVPPVGPDWGSFSIRVAENKIAEIPEILNLYVDRYEEMGKKARQAWEEWFSPEVLFHRLAENVAILMSSDDILDEWEPYRWSLILDCAAENDDSVMVRHVGQITRINRHALAAQLAAATPPERVRLYRENELWYDAAADLDSLSPGSESWNLLFQSLDLENLEQEAIAGSVIIQPAANQVLR